MSSPGLRAVLTWRSGQPSFSCHRRLPTHLVFLSSDQGVLTGRDFRLTFCSAVGSSDISNFQLREVENACILGDLTHSASW